MPILKPEPDLLPSDLFEASLPWRVAHVRSRQEKVLARFLAESGIGYYLPQTQLSGRGSRRNLSSHVPLFPGYVFFRGQREEAGRAVRSNVIVSILVPPDQESFEREIRQLYDLQRANGRLVPFHDIVPGDPVLIKEGAFAGYRGVVVRERSAERLIVSISFIRQSVVAELGRDAVSALKEGQRPRR